MSASSNGTGPVRAITPGRFTKACVHSPAGQIEARLSEAGNWELRVKADDDHSWRLVCRGDMNSGMALDEPVAPSREPIRLGALTVDRAARSAMVDGTSVQLSKKEFGLLVTLASQPNRVFTKPELLRAVWGYPAGARTRTLDSHASRLRRKLHCAGAQNVVINSWGVGYRFWDATDLVSVPAIAA